MATAAPVAKLHWVQSDCQHSLGRWKQNLLFADFGRFCGWATITPWRVKIRHTVDRDGTASPWRVSAHTIDCGP